MPGRDQTQTSNRGFASMDEKKQRETASKGGQASGGNFKNDPERAAEAGRKGGHDVPAEERERASKAGRNGGEHSHDRR
ncbi:MAG: general stress protein [Stellaceae bacterium]